MLQGRWGMRDRMGDVVIRNFNIGCDFFVDVSFAHTLCWINWLKTP